VDSSVSVAALVLDHEAQQLSDEALTASGVTIAHVASETYSVLTRLPGALRVDGARATSIIRARLPRDVVALDPSEHMSALETLAAARIGGGATYDGLIALAAKRHGLQLVSRDLRAARTYEALGVPHRLLSD
jgi:predicted nucleic acid-binding protein